MPPTESITETLAIDGDPKAMEHLTGAAEPKVGVDEFFSIAQRFGFSDAALQRIREAVTNDDLSPRGPHLGRYYGSAKPSMGERFEELARDQFQVKHAYAVCNGTSALQAAMVAVGVEPGDEVIVPGIGFIATALAGTMVGATPVFCDVDTSLQMDPNRLDGLITPRTKAILPTHHWGFVCDMDRIMAVARQHNVAVIEDCATAPGASYKGVPVGSIGDLGCYSISSYKIIGGGEGGMVVTQDDRLYDRARQASEAGGLWRPVRCEPPRYEGELFIGGNYRLSELESAVNVVQIGKLPDIVARHRRVWRRIRKQLGTFEGIQWQTSNDPDGDIGDLMRFFPADNELGQRIAEALVAEGLPASYRGTGAKPDYHCCRHFYPILGVEASHRLAESCPVASDLFDRRLALNLNQWWSDADADAAVGAINKVLTRYCGRA